MENQKTENKKIHFISLGCPKNLVDSEIMLATVQKSGYEVTEQVKQAEVVVINTCGFSTLR